MKRMPRRLLLALTFGFVVTALGLLYPAPAEATESVLDQSQTTQNTSEEIGSSAQGEIFTAGKSGYLTRVSLYLGQYVSSTGGAGVLIDTVTSDGLPSGTHIGNGRFSFDAIPVSGGWVNVDITGAFVTAGTQYALLVFTATSDTVLWYAGTGDVKPYASGYWVSQTGDGWQKILTNQDWAFKTYVAPDTLDQNQSQTSGTGGGTRSLSTTPVGQTFTVGFYGLLDRVSVYLTNSSTTPAPITVTILKVGSNGLPVSGTQVAIGTIPAAAIPTPYSRKWASASIKPLLVKPGERYAILLSTGGSGVQWVLVSDVYSGGTQVIRNGTSWVATTSDFAFQTYVLTPILDQAQTAYAHGEWLGSGYQLAQYFTAHISGLLDHVRVVLAASDCPVCEPPSADITVGISWAPSDPPLGSGTIPVSSIPDYDFPLWLDASISGLYVRAGSQYALTLNEPSSGALAWWYQGGDVYPGGYEAVGYGSVWENRPGNDMAFQTYVLPVPTITTAPGPGIRPCSGGACPSASGGFNPADLTGGVRSNFQFRERPNGTVHGVFNFSDPRPDGIALRGCTTESAACALTVTSLACTDPQSMTVGGTFTPRGGANTHYELTLSKSSDGSGTFSLTAGDYSFTMRLNSNINITCPPPGTPVGP